MVERILNQSIQYLPEASDLFARMDVQPSNYRKTLINEFIFQLQIAGIWSELDCLYILAAEDEQSAQLNWKSSSFNLTKVSTPTFTADRGYVGGANTIYLNTNFTPNTHGVKFLGSSSSWGFYSRTNGAGTDWDMGSSITTFFLRNNGTHTCRFWSSQSAVAVSSPNPAGFNSSVKDGVAVTVSNYKNGVFLNSGSASSSTSGTANIDLLRVATNFSTKQFAMAFMGSKLINQLTFYNIIQWYLSKIGAAV